MAESSFPFGPGPDEDVDEAGAADEERLADLALAVRAGAGARLRGVAGLLALALVIFAGEVVGDHHEAQ
jgi:hypothetical protein